MTALQIQDYGQGSVAPLNQPHQGQPQSAQVYYNDFHTDKRKSKFNITQDDWDIIRRNNAPDKTLAEKPKKLLGKVYKLIEQNKDGKAWFSYKTLAKMLNCKKWQIIQIRKEIAHIVKSKWRQKTKIGGSMKCNVIVFEYTKNGQDILARPHIYYGNECYTNVKACGFPNAPIKKYEKNVIKKDLTRALGSNLLLNSKTISPSSETQNLVEIKKLVPKDEDIIIPTEATKVQKLRITPPNQRKKVTNSDKKARLYNFRQYPKPKTLTDMHPLLDQAMYDELRSESGRDFCNTFIEQTVLKMANKPHVKPTFNYRKGFICYMGKALLEELHDAVKTNNINFHYKQNKSSAEIAEYASISDRDNYLSGVETRAYTHRTDENQYRAKIVGTMPPWQAYNFLSNLKAVRKVGLTLELYTTKQVELTLYALESVLQEAQAVGNSYGGVEELEFCT